jgi:hypothetical protein
MVRRFTVIQGGLHGTPARQPAPDRPRPPLTLAWSRGAQSVPAAPVVLNSEVAEAVDRAIRTRLAALGRPVRSAAATPARTVERPHRQRAIPAENLLGVRPEGWAPPKVAVPVFADRTPAIAAPSGNTWDRLSARSGVLRSACLHRIEAFATGMFDRGAGPMVWHRARG